MLMIVTISGRPGGPSRSAPERGGDGGISILPIIGGLVLGAGLLAFAYYISQQTQTPKGETRKIRIICPQILPHRRKWMTDEEAEYRKLQEEKLKKLREKRKIKMCPKILPHRRKWLTDEEECEYKKLEEEKFREKLKEKMEALADPLETGGQTCVNNPDIKKYLPIIAGVTVGLGVLSLLSIGSKPSPSNLSAMPMSSAPIPYGSGLTPRAVTIEESEIDECEECLKIDPRKRRWPTFEEEQEEYKRIRERDEQKRKLELLVQECISKYENSLECDNTEFDENASGPWEK
ncbi:unnamed protein product [Spodoptera exigua]|nr:unnamed protein product [Spodoptera exigua]